jgi:DNA invertase Pin-like site-specific DNA recombinase
LAEVLHHASLTMDPNDRSIRAAQYVRMSTEHQQYSTQNQARVIAEYADAHHMEIVRRYEDLGKSGLTLRQRDGLRRLLEDVESGSADFNAVLVYDVSRWGRFQDADESAFYEYRCKRAKIAVHYCAELFKNDGSISSSILKTLKRAMAGEYSRELSAKVFAGKSRLAELGFRQGGTAGYGLRRMLLDRDGNPKGLLRPGDRKNLFTDRVILVPGPDDEIKIVREIYEQFEVKRHSPTAIARFLNERGVPTESGRPWTLAMIRNILTNPKYVGVNVSNRTSYKLGTRPIRNPPERWVRRENAFAAIIDEDLFEKAQRTMQARVRHDTDEEVLQKLKALLERKGTLSGRLIDKSPDTPSSNVYACRFGSLLAAYRKIGYVPPDDYSFVKENPRLRLLQAKYLDELCRVLTNLGVSVHRESGSQIIRLNNFSVFFAVVRCRHTKYRGDRWIMPMMPQHIADIRVAARMAPDNESILDYYAFPRSFNLAPRLDLGITNDILIDVHRFPDLSFLDNLAIVQKVKNQT